MSYLLTRSVYFLPYRNCRSVRRHPPYRNTRRIIVVARNTIIGQLGIIVPLFVSDTFT